MIRVIYDSIRAPYDIANILQVVLAIGECELHFTGNSLRHDHPKVLGKVKSWSSKIRKFGLPDLPIYYHATLADCVKIMHDKGVKLIGTSSSSENSFFDLDLSRNNFAIVFGTEVGGLSIPKVALMNEMVYLPMSNEIDFMTLSIITPIVVYEIIRQQNSKKK